MKHWVTTWVVVAIHMTGVCFNLFILWKSSEKTTWQNLNNIKFLIVTQVVHSIIAIVSNLGLSVLGSLPNNFCTALPATIVFSLSFALFNLTFFAIVKHAQLTSTWKLRVSSVIWIILAELILTTLLLLPVVYSAAKGSSIIVCENPRCLNDTLTKSAVSSVVNINVVSYAIVFIGFQFVIPGIIVISRIILAEIYLWKNGKNDKERKKNRICKNMPKWINWFCVVFGFFVFLFSSRFEESEENLKIMSDVFHTFRSFCLAFICFPLYLLDELSLEKAQKVSKLSIHGDINDASQFITDKSDDGDDLLIEV